ncbi:formate dehydrogenase accessory sulfurtransferase FdhD [Pseudoxanthomonas wuyuanensis]
MPADRAVPGSGVARRAVIQVEGGVAVPAQDLLAEEVPVAIHYNGEPFAVMMASPGDLDDFAYGFSLTEAGVAPGGILAVATQQLLEGIRLDIRTREPLPADTASASRRSLPGRSGCGICGNRLLEDVLKQPGPVREGGAVDAAALDAALAGLSQWQPLNAATGAIHAAAWSRIDGSLVMVREDVGRHNALDKLIGAMRREGVDAKAGFAVVTSRASYEMATKAALAGIPLLAAISAPTALAVDLAQRCGLTLAGFVRPGRHVIYSHAWRLKRGSEA